MRSLMTLVIAVICLVCVAEAQNEFKLNAKFSETDGNWVTACLGTSVTWGTEVLSPISIKDDIGKCDRDL